MSRPLILARSPFFATIDEAVSKGSKVELWVWANGETMPVAPSYVFQKLIPSPANKRMTYELSSYIQEKFNFIHPYTDIDLGTWWVNVRVRRYNLDNTSTYVELDDIYYYAVNGYQNLEVNNIYQGNVDIPLCINSNVFLSQEIDYVYGQFQPLYFVNAGGHTITYSSGETGGSVTIPNDEPYCFAYNFDGENPYWGGNITIEISGEFLNTSWQFRQNDDCNNNGVIWYLNCFGVWESTDTKGSIKSSVNITSNEYQFIDPTIWTESNSNAFPSYFGEKQQFNTNGTRTFTLNTNWKPERWNLILEQIMLSEHINFLDVNSRVLIANVYPFPCKLNTKSIQLNRHLTDKLINYQLELELLQSMVYTQL